MGRPSTREKLLDCAEQLFAERGLDAVSLRSINAEAGLSAAALHYHFGSKQSLLDALLERRMAQPMEQRAKMLDALEAHPLAPTSREVLEALIRPLAELVAREGEGGRRYVRLLSRLQADGNIWGHRFVGERYAEGITRLEPLLQCALPDLPTPLVRVRFALAIELLLRSLAGWEGLAAQLQDGETSLDEFVDGLLDFLTGAMEAPNSLTLSHFGATPNATAATSRDARMPGDDT
jgi:AcrR family transcriptional regulator